MSDKINFEQECNANISSQSKITAAKFSDNDIKDLTNLQESVIRMHHGLSLDDDKQNLENKTDIPSLAKTISALEQSSFIKYHNSQIPCEKNDDSAELSAGNDKTKDIIKYLKSLTKKTKL